MRGVETVLFLVIVAALVATFANRLRVPAPSLLVLAGLGHILLTVGLVLLFITLGKRIPAKAKPAAESDPAPPADAVAPAAS